jgi:hypothetical protein
MVRRKSIVCCASSFMFWREAWNEWWIVVR